MFVHCPSTILSVPLRHLFHYAIAVGVYQPQRSRSLQAVPYSSPAELKIFLAPLFFGTMAFASKVVALLASTQISFSNCLRCLHLEKQFRAPSLGSQLKASYYQTPLLLRQIVVLCFGKMDSLLCPLF